MDDKELDRLFRQRLDQNEIEPTPQAWQQLENHLHQKKSRKPWIYVSSVAASLLLLFGVWAAIHFSSTALPNHSVVREEGEKTIPVDSGKTPQGISQNPRQEKSTNAPLVSGAKEKNILAEKEAPAPKEAKEDKETGSKLKAEKKRKAKTESRMAIASPKPETQERTTAPLKEAEGKVYKEFLIEPVKENVPLQIPEAPYETIVIEYKADNEPERTERAGEVTKLAEATKREEKDLSAKKVIGFLQKVKKNSTGNLAELREAKDELLSFRIGKEE